MANGWWGDWRPSLPAHTGNLQATDLIECTSIIGGVPTNTAITGTQIIAAASGGSATWGAITGTLSTQTDLQNALNAKQDKNILLATTAVVTVSGTTSETLIASVPIPTNITNAMIRVSFINRVVVLGAAAPRSRMRMGTFASPTLAQITASTILATNSIGSLGMSSIYRTMPVVGGASGNIKVIQSGGNVNSDFGQLAAFEVKNFDFTTQQYLYFTIANNTTAASVECYGIVVEHLKS
jgi:hypothetical protein